MAALNGGIDAIRTTSNSTVQLCSCQTAIESFGPNQTEFWRCSTWNFFGHFSSAFNRHCPTEYTVTFMMTDAVPAVSSSDDQCCVKVAVRVRPLTAKEQLQNCNDCVSYVPGRPEVVLDSTRGYTFDWVFSPSSTQVILKRFYPPFFCMQPSRLKYMKNRFYRRLENS